MPKVWRGVGVSELFKLRNGNQGFIEMSYIEKFWRDATAADVTRVMNGEAVEARFTQNNGSTRKGFIAGWKETPAQWMDSHGLFWDQCQVYDPPQRFLDKPDPGEGYRLLGKEPDEEKHRDDEIFREGKGWEPAGFDDGKQRDGFWYRRRIEQPKPEPKHYVLQVGDTVETPSGHLIKIVDRPTEQMHYTLQVGDTADVPSGHRIAITEHGVEVT